MKRLDSAILRDLESAARAGRHREIRDYIERLRPKSIHPSDRPGVANLARRSGAVNQAIAILRPWVRPSKSPTGGTPAERAEYAACLTTIGAVSEARELLMSVSGSQYSESLLFRAFAYFPTWDYAQSIPILEDYCERVANDEYRLLVGQVNLVASLLFEQRYSESARILAKAMESARRQNALRLLGNCLELSAQQALYLGKLDRSAQLLDEATHSLRTVAALDELFVRKWRAVLELRRGRRPNTGPIASVRQDAWEHRHWETVRDCDLHLALTTRDHALLAHLYFGSPHAAYRAKITRDAGDGFSPPKHYVWDLGRPGPDRMMNVDLGLELETGLSLKAGQLLHRALQILSEDFYRPHRPAALYSRFFQGEYFNPATSIDRVHHVVLRLRNWMRANRVPLQILCNRGQFRLTGQRPYGLLLTLGEGLRESGATQVLLGRLKASLGGREFSRLHVERALGLSKRSAIRLLNDAIASGGITVAGSGPKQRYRWNG